jgi:uncharacterized protein YcbK (DUF882 family)
MKLSDHFGTEESACRCGCGFGTNPDEVNSHLLDLLEHLRHQLGDKPLRINSWCRCPAYNTRVGGTPNSAHTRGTAADISIVGGLQRRQLVDAAVMWGAAGIGISENYVHVDVDTTLVRPTIWGYMEKE